MIYIFDNFYTEKELSCIWKELEFYNSLPKDYRERSETTAVATDENGNSLGKSDRVYVNDIFTNYGKKYSHINNLSYKIISDHAEAIKIHLPNGVQIDEQNSVHNMVSYYGPNDYYDTHHDVFQFTCLIWLYKQPKKFMQRYRLSCSGTKGLLEPDDLNKALEFLIEKSTFINGQNLIIDDGWGL